MPPPSLTPDVARFLLNLVNAQTLTVGAADFDQVFPLVLAARVELSQIVTAAEET